tara:strand:- start:324 stop:1055 length:732 start_codon:yes stop_codon:yes gene_type:complete
MPTARKVSDIKANLLRPATTSHFEVTIPIPPNTLFDKWKGVGKQDKINLMCSEASLPGSSLATFETNNDRTGVTERFVHRRIFDERIDLTFYVDAGLYQPIKFFEEWIDFITGAATSPERTEFVSAQENRNELPNPEYHYRMRYPNDYIAGQGLTITKFEKDPSPSQTQDGDRQYSSAELKYEFIRSYPLSITSMPVSYDGSSLLKCSVSMTYVRYIIHNLDKINVLPPSPTQQAQSNGGAFQ